MPNGATKTKLVLMKMGTCHSEGNLLDLSEDYQYIELINRNNYFMTPLKLFISIIILLTVQTSLSAQEKKGGIAGYVMDKQTREPLIGANIIVVGTQIGAATNKMGYFAIPNLPDNRYEIEVSFIGYTKHSEKTVVTGGQFKSVSIEMVPKAVLMSGIEVTSDFHKQAERNLSTLSIPVARLKNMPAIGETDLLRSLQLLPGIQSPHEFSSGLYIRGGSPDQNLILLDGITVYNPSHFFGFFSTFNTDAIKDVKLIKGGYPAEYGGRLSAVLDITNKDGNREKFSTNGAVSLISSKLLIEGPVDKGSFMISGRRTYFDLIVPLAGIEDIPEYYFYDVKAKLNIDRFKNDRFTVSTYMGRDILNYQQKEDGTPTNKIKIGWGNRVFSGRWVHLFSPKLYSSLLIAGSDFKSKVEADASGFSFLFENKIRDFSIKADLEWFGTSDHNFKFGLWMTKYQFLSGIKIGENTGFENEIKNKPFYSALYLQDEWRPNPLWLFTSGMRFNYFSSGNRFNPEPRIQIRRQITDNFAMISSFGYYTQYTTVVVNDMASFAELWYPVDETIGALKSQQYILGVDYSIKQSYNLKVEIYHKPMQNIVEFKPRQDTDREKLNEIFYIGSGLARGLEIMLQKTYGRLNGWLGYTWSKTERKFDRLNNGNTFPAKWDFSHDLTATASLKIFNKWLAGITFVYRSGQTYTVPTGQYRLGPPMFPIDYIRAGVKNGERLEPYHRMDLSLVYNFKKFGGDWNLTLNIFNVYNHRNVWFRNYQFDEPGEPPEISDFRLLPILPTMELSFKF